MNKYIKGCLIFIGTIALIIVLIIAGFWRYMGNSKDRAERDVAKYSKTCDSTRLITAKPSIALGKFHKNEIDILKFYVIRNNKIVKDTTVHYEITSQDHYLYTEIPFAEFQKTDTIIVETKNNAKRYYRISGFHHYVYLHYGMFGYVGSHDCRFADGNYTINGNHSNGTMLKEDGIKENILPK